MKSVITTRLFLVGLMGAGKSTVGSALAGALSLPYHDNDELLVAQTGDSAAEQARAAPSTLHDNESRQLRSLIATKGAFVASAAASVADRADDLALMRRSGLVGYLRAQPDVLARRVNLAESTRPWLGETPLEVLSKMFDLRDGILQSVADIVVDCDDLEPSRIAEVLLDFVTATSLPTARQT